MDHELRHPLTDLTAGSMLPVRDGRGRAIVVFEGLVWITQDNDLRDFVLAAGESFRIDRQGLTLVEALRHSKLLLVDTEPADVELDVPSSAEIHRWARAQRSAAIAEALLRGVAVVRRALSNAAPRLSVPHATPRRLNACAAG